MKEVSKKIRRLGLTAKKIIVLSLVFIVVFLLTAGLVSRSYEKKDINTSDLDQIARLIEKTYFDTYSLTGTKDGFIFTFPENIPNASYLRNGYSYSVLNGDSGLFKVCSGTRCKSYDVTQSIYKPDNSSMITDDHICGLYYTEINRGVTIYSYDKQSNTVSFDSGKTRIFSLEGVKIYDADHRTCTELPAEALSGPYLMVPYFDSSHSPARLVAIKVLQ